MNKLLILDRDGTLIDFVRDEELGAVFSAFAPNQIKLLPGVIEALINAQKHGYSLAIATNQPGAAKGHYSVAAINKTNQALVSILNQHGITISALEVCFHHPSGTPDGEQYLKKECSCRKPEPGMLISIMKSLNTAPEQTWMIGDTLTDMQAAKRAGVRSALIMLQGRCEFCPLIGQQQRPDIAGASLKEIVEAILSCE